MKPKMKVEPERPLENGRAGKPVANRRSGRGAIPKNSLVVNVGGIDSTNRLE
jgi:hypothetical protein